MRIAVGAVALFFSLCVAEPLMAQRCAKVITQTKAKQIQLFDAALRPVATVPAGPQWSGWPALDDHPSRFDLFAIDYWGSPEAPASRYYVRRAELVVKSVTRTTGPKTPTPSTSPGINGMGTACE